MAGLSTCPRTVYSRHSFDTKCHAAAHLSQKQSSVLTGASLQLQQRSLVRTSRVAVVEVVSFKFMKKLGVKKPGFLPDFGKVCSAGSSHQMYWLIHAALEGIALFAVYLQHDLVCGGM